MAEERKLTVDMKGYEEAKLKAQVSAGALDSGKKALVVECIRRERERFRYIIILCTEMLCMFRLCMVSMHSYSR